MKMFPFIIFMPVSHWKFCTTDAFKISKIRCSTPCNLFTFGEYYYLVLLCFWLRFIVRDCWRTNFEMLIPSLSSLIPPLPSKRLWQCGCIQAAGAVVWKSLRARGTAVCVCHWLEALWRCLPAPCSSQSQRSLLHNESRGGWGGLGGAGWQAGKMAVDG